MMTMTRTTPVKMRMRDGGLVGAIAALLLALPAGAQGVPTPPAPPSPPAAPRSPRPPRPPRAPRSWFGSGDRGVSRIDTTLSFAANGNIELSLVSGTMKVSTWDRNQVRVVATATQPSLQFDASDSHLDLEQVKTRRRDDGNDNVGTATYDVTVPAGSRASLSAVAGSIDVSGVRGRLEVSNVSGSIDVRNAGSSVNAEGVSGRITIQNVGGDAHVENVSGRVSLTGVAGSANVETVSGTIVVAGVRGERVHATSVSGGIDFTGSVSPSGRYEFETHSGRTDLRLGSNASAAVSVETFSGSVSNDYPGAVRRGNTDDSDDSRNYEYLIGRGGARIHVGTFSGSVHISQGNQ